MSPIAAEIAQLQKRWASRSTDRKALQDALLQIRSRVQAALSKPNALTGKTSKGAIVSALPTERKILPSSPQVVGEAERAGRYEEQLAATLKTHRPDTRQANERPLASDVDYLENLELACTSLLRALSEDAPSDTIDVLVQRLPLQ